MNPAEDKDMAKKPTKKAASEANEVKGGSPHSFAMHQPERINMMPSFERIAKIFAGEVKLCLELITNDKLTVEAGKTELVSYLDWCESQPGITGMTKFRMPPCKGPFLLCIEPAMIASLVDSFYGGSTVQKYKKNRVLTPMEQELHHQISEKMCSALASSWGIYGTFETKISGRETNPVYVGLTGTGEMILRQSFTITYPDKRQFVIALLYEMDAVRSLEAVLEPTVGQDREQANPVWAYELREAISEVRLPVRSVLARTTMTLPQLAELQPGDIIPIPPARNLPLIIGEKIFARGNLGEQDGCAAYKIEKMEQGSEL